MKITVKYPDGMTGVEAMRVIRPILNLDEHLLLTKKEGPTYGKEYTFKDAPYEVKAHRAKLGLCFEIKYAVKKKEDKDGNHADEG